MKRTDIDLAGGGFRMDLKTGLVLMALAFQWWDGRAQEEKRAAIQEVQNRTVESALSEMKQLQKLQGIEMGELKVALAANGIKLVNRKD